VDPAVKPPVVVPAEVVKSPAPKDPGTAKPAVPKPEPKREPAPTAAAKKEAEAVVRDLFKDDYAKKTPAERGILARKLLKLAKETKDDPVGRFVLLTEAMELGVLAGEVCGIEHYRHAGRHRIRAQLARQDIAVHARHEDIRDNEIRRDGARLRQRLRRAGCPRHLVTRHFQQRGQRFAIRAIVVDDQYRTHEG
jgi:hypothetical protein